MASPIPHPSPPPPSLYPLDLDSTTPDMNDKPGEEVLDFKAFSWRVSWYEQECDAIRSPRFEVGGHQWSLSIRPNRELETGLISVVLNHESPELLTGEAEDHICARLAISMATSNISPLLPRNRTFIERGAYRFTPTRKLYGIPSFGLRKDLVKWCVGSDDDSILTVHLKVLKDETGYRFYPFHQARYDSREKIGLVSLRKYEDFTDVGLLPLWSIPEVRKLVYSLPELPSSPSGKKDMTVRSLQALFYALEVAEQSVSTDRIVLALQNRAATFGAERGEAMRYALDALRDCQLPGAPSRKLFHDLLSSRTLRRPEEGSLTLDYTDCITIAPIRRFTSNDLLSALHRLLVTRPSLSDFPPSPSSTSIKPEDRISLFDLPPFLTIDLGPPVTSGSPAPRFTFPTTLDLHSYLPYTSPELAAKALLHLPSPPQLRPSSKYRLHTVLVQLPDLNLPNLIKKGKRVLSESYAFIRPEADGPWFKHRDERVVVVTEKEVLETAFGGRGVRQTEEFGVAVAVVYADTVWEKARGKVKEGRPGIGVREWVKDNFQLKKGEPLSPYSRTETVACLTGIAGIAVVAVGVLAMGVRAAARWRRT